MPKVNPEQFLGDPFLQIVVDQIDADAEAVALAAKMSTQALAEGEGAHGAGMLIREEITNTAGDGLGREMLHAFMLAVPASLLGAYYLARFGAERDEDGAWSFPAESEAAQ